MTPKEKKSGLTAAWLRENMSYDPLTGDFAWIKPGFGRTLGKTIGSKVKPHGEAYMTMKVNGTVFYAHRLAWLHHYGEWPSASVDHIDADRLNNAIANLRIATPAQNAARRPTTRLIGTSRGVFPQRGGFVARINHGGERHYIGFFKTAELAQAAYEAKAKEIHGEFAHATEPKAARGDFLNAKACEACGSEHNLRLDRTRIGTPRGMLCVDCWGVLLVHGADAKKIHRWASQMVRYVARLDVVEEIPDGMTFGEFVAEHKPDQDTQ